MFNTENLIKNSNDIDVVREQNDWVVDGIAYPLSVSRKDIKERQQGLLEEWERLEALKKAMDLPENKEVIDALLEFAEGKRIYGEERIFIAGYMAAKGEK